MSECIIKYTWKYTDAVRAQCLLTLVLTILPLCKEGVFTVLKIDYVHLIMYM